MTRIGATRRETSCILSNLFVELRPVCDLCEEDAVVIRGVTYEGDEETVILRDYGFDYTGRRDTIARIRERRCVNVYAKKLSARIE